MATANTYDVGDLVRLSAAFTVGGVATDPTALTLRVKSPSGTVTTYTYAAAEILRDSAGNFHRDVTPDAAGTWTYGFTGTGAAQAVGEEYFYVRRSAFS